MLVISSEIILAQDKDCLDCHSNKNLTYTRNHKEISLYVDAVKFQASVHGDLDCVDCHEDFNPKKIPHKAGKNIAKVNCGNCHDDVAGSFKTNIHERIKPRKGRYTPTCITCHGNHYIKNPSEISNENQYYCGKCHTNVELTGNFHSTKYYSDKFCGDCHESEDVRDSLKTSVHAQLACSDCHKYEANNFEKHQDNVSKMDIADCSLCHKKEYDEHKESIHGISLSEGVDEAADCWDCHGSHNILPINSNKSPVYITNIPSTCGNCHANKKFQEKFDFPVANPVQTYSQSVHGKLLAQGAVNVPTCTTCHGIHNIKNMVQPNSKISPFNIPTTCAECHNKEAKEYKESIHWIYVKMGFRFAPVCNDCHSEHGIQIVTGSVSRKEARKIQEETCMLCHQSKKLAERLGIPSDAISTYEDSYHGLAVLGGDLKAAMCVDCHGVHKILPKKNTESTVNIKNVKNTCKKCHKNATQVFSESYSHHNLTIASNKAQDIVNKIYFWLILLTIGGMFLHNLIIYIHDVIEKRKIIKQHPTIPRLTTNEVIQHIFLFSSFITLAVTGFALKYSNSWWGEGLASLGLQEGVRQIVHRTAAVIMIATGVYHIIYLIVTKRGREILGAMMPKFKDLTQASQNISYYLGLSKTRPGFDKFDYTEKAEYWALIWGTIIMGATGLLLWFPTSVGNWAPIWLIKVSQSIHFYEAILATLAIVVWHWFFVIFHPKEYPMNVTWIDGKMSLLEYFHHHKYSMYKVIIEWYKFKTGLITEGSFSYDTKMLLSSLENQKLNIDEIFFDLIKNDSELKNILEKEKLNINTKQTDS